MRVCRFGACSHKPLLCGFSKLRLRGEVWPQVGNRGPPGVGAPLVAHMIVTGFWFKLASRSPPPAHFNRYKTWFGGRWPAGCPCADP